MPATRYNCWLATETGASQIDFVEGESCWPTPQLKRDAIGSDHQMLPGLVGPGQTYRQDFGWTSGVLEVTVPFCTWATVAAVEALCYRWDSGSRPAVQFHNGRQTWLCQWKANPVVTRREDCIDKYALRFELQVVEEI